jgi:hypothetical protein
MEITKEDELLTFKIRIKKISGQRIQYISFNDIINSEADPDILRLYKQEKPYVIASKFNEFIILVTSTDTLHITVNSIVSLTHHNLNMELIEIAKKRLVKIIDEYDRVDDSLLLIEI